MDPMFGKAYVDLHLYAIGIGINGFQWGYHVQFDCSMGEELFNYLNTGDMPCGSTN